MANINGTGCENPDEVMEMLLGRRPFCKGNRSSYERHPTNL